MRLNKFLKYYPVLLPAIGFTMLLLGLRVLYSGNYMYLFLVWNIFLACVPLFISQVLRYKRFKLWIQISLFSAWLLFFPNALYIITDLVHLEERYPVPLVVDIILVFSAAANGLLAAYLSLWEIEKYLTRIFTSAQVKFILLSILFAGSFGVYVGRYLRWNSWDVLTDPFSILATVTNTVFYPHEYVRTWGTTVLFAIFFAATYYTLRNLKRLVIEQV